uniref:Uncharacterized protein n=1 Tax=Setaria digitata TaxID=48799 RepID=A0A915PXZ7_9BILA
MNREWCGAGKDETEGDWDGTWRRRDQKPDCHQSRNRIFGDKKYRLQISA